MSVTIKDVDENVYKNFKAEAVRRGLKVSEAATEAFRFWASLKKPRRVRNWSRIKKASKDIDRLREKSESEWSGTEEIRKWRDRRK
ncbi:hypothetical protein AKJ42_02080 [candidate division MSBL1 archaeon SCGC-AAA261C02]|uniref:Uncharacterized protein n=1 Tax=candidate division MSBL1 archaeon SCGC-AAA261C02 TaxID=1698272 RepID=A0A133V0I4_9EURY|nr:hypothetical protein AKJ42_02080 [candidate division MSBL1 archaeon SCGC-AAA261C02]